MDDDREEIGEDGAARAFARWNRCSRGARASWGFRWRFHAASRSAPSWCSSSKSAGIAG